MQIRPSPDMASMSATAGTRAMEAMVTWLVVEDRSFSGKKLSRKRKSSRGSDSKMD